MWLNKNKYSGGFNYFIVVVALFSLSALIRGDQSLKTDFHLSPVTFESSNCDTFPDIFQKIIDLTSFDELIYDLHQFPNGDYLAVGNAGFSRYDLDGFAIKFDSTGNIHWAKQLGFDAYFYPNSPWNTLDIPETFEDVLIMEDSTIFISGQRQNQGFIARLDFEGNVIWSKIIGGITNIIIGIMKNNEEEIFITGNYDLGNFNDASILIKINKAGISLNGYTWRYLQNGHQIFTYVIKENQRFTFFLRSFGQGSPWRNILVSTDENLNVLSVKKYESNSSSLSVFDCYQNIQKSNGLYYIPIVLLENTLNDRQPGIIIIDSNLNFVSGKTYKDLTSPNLEVFHDIYANKDGTLMATFANFFPYYDFPTGIYVQAEESLVLVKMDSLGNILWNRLYGGDQADPFGFIEPAENNGTMFFGQSQSFDTRGNGLYLIKTDSLGNAGGCNEDSLNIIVEDLDIIFDTASIEVDTFPYGLEDFWLPSKNLYPISRDLCCTDLPDADIAYLLPAYPCGDSIGIAMKICNTGYVDLPSDFPISFYFDNPTVVATSLQDLVNLSSPLPPDSCFYISQTLLNPPSKIVYAVAGDPGGATPYHKPCDFPLTGTEECEYNNNLRSVLIPDSIGAIHFDDEYYIACPNELYGIYLLAPFYLNNPIWNLSGDQSFGIHANDSLFVTQGGVYVLNGTTPCGDVFTDSIDVYSQFLPLDFGFTDTTICRGDTFFIAAPSPYDSIYWLSPSLFGLEISCPSSGEYCLSNTITYNNTGTIRIIGFSVPYNPSNGCAVIDTFFIHFVEPFESFQDTTICAGENINLYGEIYPAKDTTLYFSFPSLNFCDSILTYHLNLADTFYNEVNLAACPGDTVFREGQAFLPGDTQTFNYQSWRGCDSTIVVSVEALAPVFTNEVISICPYDSVLIFDNWENLPDIYEKYFVAANGCDSLHSVELIVHPEIIIDANITPGCPEEAVGKITLNAVSGAAPFEYVWSNAAGIDTVADGLVPGEYLLTITDAQGCTSFYTFSVPVYPSGDFDGQCTPQWFAPNIFTPNGDGNNDRFTLFANRHVLSIQQLQIFSRWGNLVFQADDILPNEESLGWDGLFSGKAMSPQVFVWKAVLVFDTGVQEVIYGDFVLIR